MRSTRQGTFLRFYIHRICQAQRRKHTVIIHWFQLVSTIAEFAHCSNYSSSWKINLQWCLSAQKLIQHSCQCSCRGDQTRTCRPSQPGWNGLSLWQHGKRRIIIEGMKLHFFKKKVGQVIWGSIAFSIPVFLQFSLITHVITCTNQPNLSTIVSYCKIKCFPNY